MFTMLLILYLSEIHKLTLMLFVTDKIIWKKYKLLWSIYEIKYIFK